MSRVTGQRICIIGWSSLGKSTLAAKLGKKYDIPVVHLDQLKHLPTGNWVARSQEEFEALQMQEVLKEKWVMDGNYTRTMPLRFERATPLFISG